MLSGMLYCTDCGKKLYQVRAKGWTHDKEYFVCSSYRKEKGKCTSHQIRNVQVEEILLHEMRKITSFAKEHKEEFLNMVMEKSEKDVNRTLRKSRTELDKNRARYTKLDEIVKNLYEDNIDGKISDERFTSLSLNYDNEQKALKEQIINLENEIDSLKAKTLNTESFMKLVNKYTDIKELDAEIIRVFVEKIYVEQSQKIEGTRTKKQTIWIVWNYIGQVDIPDIK